jgi:hypothetical protein
MQRALKILALPVALIAAAGVGLLGSWAMPVGSVLLLVACVVAAVEMEARDLTSIQGLAATAADEAPTPVIAAVEPPVLEAA